jgi:hypothetical protein
MSLSISFERKDQNEFSSEYNNNKIANYSLPVVLKIAEVYNDTYRLSANSQTPSGGIQESHFTKSGINDDISWLIVLQTNAT